MNKYIPVPCEVYGNYELAILRHAKMRFCWRTGRNIIRVISAVPVNIRSRNRGEYLILRSPSGALLALRLDRIIRASLFNPEKEESPELV